MHTPSARSLQAKGGVVLGDLSWPEAEAALTPDRVVVLPLGAAAKEHGPHLRLDNDLCMAEGLARIVMDARDVVIAPAIAYHCYPAFVEYPGSTTLRHETARDLVVDVVESLARHGPRRFYVLNTGISTRAPLADAAALLADRGVALAYTDPSRATAEVARAILEQEAGTHADEAETSMMLVLAPERVDMKKAVRDVHPKHGPKLTRDAARSLDGIYSASGVYGDATLATREKGERLVDAFVASVLADLDALAAAPLPSPSPSPSPSMRNVR